MPRENELVAFFPAVTRTRIFRELEKLPVAILTIWANLAMQLNRVIALGSPHGDDQVAWQLAERLRACRDPEIDPISLNDPLRICDHLEGCDRLIVIDACVGTGEPGMLSRLEWPDPRILVRHAHSSHGFGVAGALQLAERLGRLPPTVVLFAVEIAQCTPGGSLSDVLENVLDELRRRVLLEIQQAPNRRS